MGTVFASTFISALYLNAAPILEDPKYANFDLFRDVMTEAKKIYRENAELGVDKESRGLMNSIRFCAPYVALGLLNVASYVLAAYRVLKPKVEDPTSLVDIITRSFDENLGYFYDGMRKGMQMGGDRLMSLKALLTAQVPLMGKVSLFEWEWVLSICVYGLWVYGAMGL